MGTGGYQLGVDLGTTYTGAAVRRDGVSEIVTLGTRSATMPTVVVAAPDGSLLVGEAAERRALELPERTARQFKRRLGDTTPILLGGTPYSPQALLAAVLADVVARVTEEQGGPPERVCLTHPANWGPYKRELVRQIAELAGLRVDQVVTLTEPAAAALHYASQAHLEPGSTVAVYDLGGGTFDAAIVRVDLGGAEILGEPTGIEHLGGIDFDVVVFDHVARELGPRAAPILDGDAEDQPALWRLREECSRAKEALSIDSDAVVGVALPDGLAEVRITRGEFESMVRPALAPTALSMRRAVESAGIVADDVAGVLLVGGSSRIPLVSEIVGSELGRPVLLDAHPKHAVALGAAAHAAGAEVGAVVEVIGGEIDLEPARGRPGWLAPVVAALVVLLAAIGVLIGLVVVDDDPETVAVDDVDAESSTSTTEASSDDTTSTTGTTVILAPGEIAPEGAVTSVLPNGDVVIVDRGSPTGGDAGDSGGDGGSGQADAGTGTTTTTGGGGSGTTATTATTAPATRPSTPVNPRVFSPVGADPNGAGTFQNVAVTLSWTAPTSSGNRPLTGYRIERTMMTEDDQVFGGTDTVATLGASATSIQLTVPTNDGQPAGGWWRWRIYAINSAGLESDPTLPVATIFNTEGQTEPNGYFLLRAIGLSGGGGGDIPGCAAQYIICEQTPESGQLYAGGDIVIRAAP